MQLSTTAPTQWLEDQALMYMSERAGGRQEWSDSSG